MRRTFPTEAWQTPSQRDDIDATLQMAALRSVTGSDDSQPLPHQSPPWSRVVGLLMAMADGIKEGERYANALAFNADQAEKAKDDAWFDQMRSALLLVSGAIRELLDVLDNKDYRNKRMGEPGEEL